MDFHALKGQNHIARGNAPGKGMATETVRENRMKKAKKLFRTELNGIICWKMGIIPFVRNENFSFMIGIARTIFLLVFFPRALPWASVCCPFRTFFCLYGLIITFANVILSKRFELINKF